MCNRATSSCVQRQLGYGLRSVPNQRPTLPARNVRLVRREELHGCPCGFHRDSTRACTCAPSAIARYQKRISGLLLDRIDIHVEAPRVEYEKLTGKGEAETSAQVRLRAARKRVSRSALGGGGGKARWRSERLIGIA